MVSVNELNKFVDKDVWVRVRALLHGVFCYGYARFLSRDVENEPSSYDPNRSYEVVYYTFNFIDLGKISRGGEFHCEQSTKDWYLDKTYKEAEGTIKLLKPVDLLGTEDLFVVEGQGE